MFGAQMGWIAATYHHSREEPLFHIGFIPVRPLELTVLSFASTAGLVVMKLAYPYMESGTLFVVLVLRRSVVWVGRSLWRRLKR